MAEKFLNLVGGKWVPAKSGEFFENRNPANWEELIGLFPKSGPEDVDAAVGAAKEAFRSWRLVPAPKRAEIIVRAGEILRARKEELARDMTREMGKVIAETRGDVQEAIDCAYFAAGEGRRLYGDTTPSELPDKMALSIRCPIGVAALITPWNFPMAIPSWKAFPALVAGNTIVLKPATETPLSSYHLFRVLEEAGMPPGVVNLVTGGGSSCGQPLAEHRDVGVVSFTGSSAVGKLLAQATGQSLKRLSLELGGKNAQVVMDDADIDLAIEGALWGAFGTTGQRCTATSRLILHRPIAAEFTRRLVAAAGQIAIGNGLDAGVQMGPTVSEKQRQTVHDYVEIGRKEGAKLLLGGASLTEGPHANGWFHQPTIFGDVTPGMRIAQEEIFGPVLSILTVDSFEEAIAVLNDTVYGLSSSIYTRDVNRAMRAIRDIEAGITYINGPTIGAEVHLPFGGVKETGNGHREASHTVLDIFTEWKSVYIDYSGRLQRAQIDNY
ncbi:MAG: aldehyde dehydrogenase family protein [Candidatus Eisenbacteria bacterium]|nr:aldehyde dehydrogenase family protein [Candidatus Eisenbacteria bacterium]